MIHYFYHLDYPSTPSEDAEMEGSEIDVPAETEASATTVHLIEHAKAFAMAVKYQAGGLRTLATAKFKASVVKDWEHGDFAHTIYIVYTSTPDDVMELRTIVADAVHEHEKYFVDIPEIESLACSLPSFAYDLLQRSRARDERSTEVDTLCSRCSRWSTHTRATPRSWCRACEKYMLRCHFCYYTNYVCQWCSSALVQRDQSQIRSWMSQFMCGTGEARKSYTRCTRCPFCDSLSFLIALAFPQSTLVLSSLA